MFRLALLAIAAVNAEPSSESMDADMESAVPTKANNRQLWFAKGRYARVSVENDDGTFKGTLRAYRVRKSGQYAVKFKWSISKNSVDCPLGLPYHVHAGAASGGVGKCDGTQNHWDKLFACGAKSQGRYDGGDFDGSACAALCAGGFTDSCTYECSTSAQNKCESGDLSGKGGNIPKGHTGSVSYTDTTLSSTAALGGPGALSVAVHCKSDSGNPKIACNNW